MSSQGIFVLVLVLFLGQCLLIQGLEVNCPGCQSSNKTECPPGCAFCHENVNPTCLNGFVRSISKLKCSCNDVNECVECDDSCQHLCNNIMGSYTCNCRHGFELTSDGHKCTDIDECETGHGCAQICINTPGSYTCDCHPGFTLAADGFHCTDIDECVEPDQSKICPSKSDCWNTFGSYGCVCKPGYNCLLHDSCSGETCTCNGAVIHMGHKEPGGCSGTGPHSCTCSNINECTINNGGCEINCTDTDGSYSCSCDVDGYRLADDGHRCDDIDECAEGDHRCQQVCNNTRGSYICDCNPGYKLDSDGYSCIDKNECDEGTDGCMQICTNTIGSYFCSCREGYCLQEDGTSCIECNKTIHDIRRCEKNNCTCDDNCYYNRDGSRFETCVDTNSSCYCRCPPGYRLATDDPHNSDCKEINKCEEGYPCGKGGICKKNLHGYACSCPDNTNPVYDKNDEIIRCNDINECDLKRHNCDTKCENTFGNFACYCCNNHKDFECDSDKTGSDCLCPGVNGPQDLTFDRLSIECSKTEVKISWRPPQGLTVMKYTIVYRAPYDEPQYLKQVELPGTANSYTAIQLDPGTDYEFCVTAKTDQGETPFTCSTTTTEEDVPKSPPRNIECTSVGSDNIDIAWMEPERPSGVITNYTLYIHCLDQFGTTIIETFKRSAHSVPLTGLECKTVIMIQMSANTSKGEGVKSGYMAFNTTEENISPLCPKHGPFTRNEGCGPDNDDMKFTCGVKPSPCQSDLPPLKNGAITYDKGSPNNRPIGTVATHTCDNGFTLKGRNIRICQNGAWNDSAPIATCVRNYCLDLPPLDNGIIAYNKGSPGNRPVYTVATYTCANGYIFNGANVNRNCQLGGEWSGSAPTCDSPHRCQCSHGYRLGEGTGCNCVDVDECAEGTDQCEQNCINTDGTYTCSCRRGYRLNANQHNCDDIDECYEGTHNCEHNCHNKEGSFFCSCYNGYTINTQNGRTCDWICNLI